jgi:beta-galactosidase
MTPGSDNVIAVMVSNTAVSDVAPLNADFTFFGGLYRDVHVLITEPVHVDTMDFASSGVYVSPTNVSATAHAGTACASATIRRGPGGHGRHGRGARGRTIATRLSATSSVRGDATLLSRRRAFPNPHLWNGVADPYLYTVYAEVRVGGAVVDVVSVPLGFRFFSVDAAQGFSLNGQYLDLHGVNRHQDRLNMGWAITNAQHDEDMALIARWAPTSSACRTTSTPDYFHDSADRAGRRAVGRRSRWSTTSPTTPRSPPMRRQQLTELIRQNYNHPSVLMWGIGNEQRADNTATNTLLTGAEHAARPGGIRAG